jgi:hypothetical protein
VWERASLEKRNLMRDAKNKNKYNSISRRGKGDLRLMSYGGSGPMLCVSVGSQEEVDTEDLSNVQHYTFWLYDLQPGGMIVQAFDYGGQIYRVVIENWTYSFKGGDTMNAILSPDQQNSDNNPCDLPLAQSM